MHQAVSRAAAVLSIGMCLAVTACSGSDDDPEPKPTTSTAAITDQPPYWCTVVPKQALHLIDGKKPDASAEDLGPPYQGRRYGSMPSRCRVGDGLLIMSRDIDSAADRHIEKIAPASMQPNSQALPSELGRGYASGSKSYWQVYSYFRCGSVHNMLHLEFSDVVTGRKHDQDLIALVRIAQKRMARDAGCTVAPVGAPASPTTSGNGDA